MDVKLLDGDCLSFQIERFRNEEDIVLAEPRRQELAYYQQGLLVVPNPQPLEVLRAICLELVAGGAPWKAATLINVQHQDVFYDTLLYPEHRQRCLSGYAVIEKGIKIGGFTYLEQGNRDGFGRSQLIDIHPPGLPLPQAIAVLDFVTRAIPVVDPRRFVFSPLKQTAAEHRVVCHQVCDSKPGFSRLVAEISYPRHQDGTLTLTGVPLRKFPEFLEGLIRYDPFSRIWPRPNQAHRFSLLSSLDMSTLTFISAESNLRPQVRLEANQEYTLYLPDCPLSSLHDLSKMIGYLPENYAFITGKKPEQTINQKIGHAIL